MFRLLTPKRWELLERLRGTGPLAIRALARMLGRDVRCVHDDVMALIDAGLISRNQEGKVLVPYGEIRADFRLGRDAA